MLATPTVVLGKALGVPRVTCGTPGAEGEAGAVLELHPITVQPRTPTERLERAQRTKGKLLQEKDIGIIGLYVPIFIPHLQGCEKTRENAA